MSIEEQIHEIANENEIEIGDENIDESDLSVSSLESEPDWLAKIRLKVSEIALKCNCYLYEIEYGSRILRIYIDSDMQKSNENEVTNDLEMDTSSDFVVDSSLSSGPSISNCEFVSRELSLFLDESNIVPNENYYLEVSSPGLERVLKRDWHFKKVIGKKVKIRAKNQLSHYGLTSGTLKTSKGFESKLVSFENQSAEFFIQGEKVQIPLNEIEKSRLVFEINRSDESEKKKSVKNKSDKKNFEKKNKKFNKK